MSARIAILGAGVMGTFHAASAARASSVELVLVADPRPGLAQRVAERHDCEWTQDIAQTFTREGLDAVIIATPVETHLPLVERAASRGLGIFCEKPLAPTLADCRNAIAFAEKAAVPLQVGFHRRFDSDWIRLKQATQDGSLGDIYMLKSTLRDMVPPEIDYIRTSGGYFVDAFVHDFDAARWLAGEVTSITAVGVALSEPFSAADDFDNAAVILRFESGALGVLDGSRLGGYGYTCTTEIVGSRATMAIEDPPAASIREFREGVVQSNLATTFLERFAPAYQREVEEFGAVVSSGARPAVDGRDAVNALAIACAASLSAKRRATVELREIFEPMDAEMTTQ